MQATMSTFTSRVSGAARPAARGSVVVTAASRPTWYPGATPPKHLDNSMPGDYGFDPLRIGANPTTLPYLREAELMNGRWAMAGVAGILATDLLGKGDWWTAGAQPGATGSFDLQTLVVVELAVFAVLEALRIRNYEKTGDSGLDPMGMKSAEMRVKEIKNGRLAMVAILGFASQAAVRGLGPIECLQAHIADPAHTNIFTSSVGNEALVGVMALAIVPTLIEARNRLSGPDDEEFRPIPF